MLKMILILMVRNFFFLKIIIFIRKDIKTNIIDNNNDIKKIIEKFEKPKIIPSNNKLISRKKENKMGFGIYKFFQII